MVYAIFILAFFLILDSTGILKLNILFKGLLTATIIIAILYVVGLGSFYLLLKSAVEMNEGERKEKSIPFSASYNPKDKPYVKKETKNSSVTIPATSKHQGSPDLEREYINDNSKNDFLINEWYDFNNKCKTGSSNKQPDLEQCEHRDKQSGKLQSLGFCYGEKGQYEIEKEWHKCNNNSLRGNSATNANGVEFTTSD